MGNEANTNAELLPRTLTAEMLRNFVTTAHGCTHPRVGTINGRKYIAKCGSWSDYSSDEHVHNEYLADGFLRACGLNVPESREYRVDFGDGRGEQVVRLAVFLENTRPLAVAWRENKGEDRARVREQVKCAYPVISFIAGIDTFQHDNVLVDANGKLWFVDNGASFDFRASGKRKGWYWSPRTLNNPESGFFALRRHHGQYLARTILTGVPDSDLVRGCADFRFVEKVAGLPVDYQRPELLAYARLLDVAEPGETRMELVMILDRSGSMSGVVGDTIGGFNAMIENQKREKGVCRVSTVLFDGQVEVLHNRVDIGAVRPLTDREYFTRGCTALLDAVGRAIKHHVHVQRTLKPDERAEKVVFVIITDGYENASQEFTGPMVKQMIELERDTYGWEFVFLGANIDAALAAESIGICADRAVNFHCDGKGVRTNFEGISRGLSNIRKRKCFEDFDEHGDTWRTHIDRDYSSR